MSHKPRLLILITLAEAGGAQTSVSTLLPGLTAEFDVTVAAHGSGPLRDAAHAAGVPFVQLEHMRRAISPWQDIARAGRARAALPADPAGHRARPQFEGRRARPARCRSRPRARPRLHRPRLVVRRVRRPPGTPVSLGRAPLAPVDDRGGLRRRGVARRRRGRGGLPGGAHAGDPQRSRRRGFCGVRQAQGHPTGRQYRQVRVPEGFRHPRRGARRDPRGLPGSVRRRGAAADRRSQARSGSED